MLASRAIGSEFEPRSLQYKSFLHFSSKNGGKFELSMSTLKYHHPHVKKVFSLFNLGVPLSKYISLLEKGWQKIMYCLTHYAQLANEHKKAKH